MPVPRNVLSQTLDDRGVDEVDVGKKRRTLKFVFLHHLLGGADQSARGGIGFGNVRIAAEYGYLRGEIQSGSGQIRVNVRNNAVRVDYVRSYLPDLENADRKNGEVTYSYLITDD